MKRKIVAVVLASTMVFGMTACGSSGASDSSNTGSDAATDNTATDDGSEDANVTEGSSDDENTLTVWTWIRTSTSMQLKKQQRSMQKIILDSK